MTLVWVCNVVTRPPAYVFYTLCHSFFVLYCSFSPLPMSTCLSLSCSDYHSLVASASRTCQPLILFFSRQRAAAVGMVNGIGNLGNLMGSYVWKAEWGPAYHQSMAISFGALGIATVLSVCEYLFLSLSLVSSWCLRVLSFMFHRHPSSFVLHSSSFVSYLTLKSYSFQLILARTGRATPNLSRRE
jgi:hypothetical protein